MALISMILMVWRQLMALSDGRDIDGKEITDGKETTNTKLSSREVTGLVGGIWNR